MHADAEHATHPEDLSRLIVERLNAGDVDGLVALYEPDAVLALPDGQIATGSDEIRRAHERLVADRPNSSRAPSDRRCVAEIWPSRHLAWPMGR
jgi:ketosteroid isomerase-like protein